MRISGIKKTLLIWGRWIAERLNEGFEVFVAYLVGQDHRHKAHFGQVSSILSSRHTGVCFGDKSITRTASYEGILIVAMTGSFKSTGIIQPAIVSFAEQKDVSMIIFDPSGEIEALTRGYLEYQGYIVHTLCLSDPKKSTVRYNPLKRLFGGTYGDIKRFANVLVFSREDQKKDYWNLKSEETLSMTIDLSFKAFGDEASLSVCYMLIEKMAASDTSVDELVFETQCPSLKRKYAALMGLSEQTRSSILSTCLSHISVFDDPDFKELCSSDNLDMQSFREQPSVLMISQNLVDSNYSGRISNLLFIQWQRHILNQPLSDQGFDIAMIMDEYGSSFYIPRLDGALSLLRKYRAITILVAQNFSQIEEKHGIKAKTILGNTATQYWGAGLVSEAADLEKRLGRYSFENHQGRMETRDLLPRDTLTTMAPEKALILQRNQHPVIHTILPIFKNRRMMKLLALRPAVIPQTNISVASDEEE